MDGGGWYRSLVQLEAYVGDVWTCGKPSMSGRMVFV